MTMSLFDAIADTCRHCGSTDLEDYAKPAWYRHRVVLCKGCDRASVIRRDETSAP